MSLVNVHLAEATFPFTGNDEDEVCAVISADTNTT